MTKPLIEALKELTRTFILGMVPVLGGILLFIKSGINVEVGGFNINWMVALAMLVAGAIGTLQTALMSALDKWLHENDVKTVLDLKSFDSLTKLK